MAKTVNIAFVFDDKFSDLFRVAVHSIAKNTEDCLAIYVVNCGILEENVGKILELKERHKNILSINFGIPERVNVFEKRSIPHRFSSAIFYRLAIPRIFPELQRVIYLDCDVIAVGDIAELWSEDLRDRTFGAIEEDGTLFPDLPRRKMKYELGIPERNMYYNSGVLLIDCRRFEEAKIFERVINLIKNTNFFLQFPDQDAMNMCIKNGEHMPLSQKYNFIPCAPLAKSCLKKIINPVIIQYASFKPWMLNRTLMKAFHWLGFFKFSTSIFLKFWEYADEVNFPTSKKKYCNDTLKFFYKELFQPIERFFRWKFIDTPFTFLEKYLKDKTSGPARTQEFRDETINIAFVFDNKFSDLARIALHSAARNTKSRLAVHIVDCGISDENIKKIMLMEEKYENIFSIEIKVPERKEVFEKFSMPGKYTSAVFYRLMLPKIFPNLNRAIYLDCDTITVGDISDLWNENLENRPFGAVVEDCNFFDPIPNRFKRYAKFKFGRKKHYRLDVGKKYYNTGVLLIDCLRFEEAKISERVIDFLGRANRKLACPDQDAVNICVNDGECACLSPVYNYIPMTDLSKKCLIEHGTPVIIQYACEKPWRFSMAVAKFFNSIGFFKYSTSLMIAFWNCAAAVDGINMEKFYSKKVMRNIRFYKNRTLRPIAHFFRDWIAHLRQHFAKILTKISFGKGKSNKNSTKKSKSNKISI